MKTKLTITLIFLVSFLFSSAQKTEISAITNKAPFNPKPGMEELRKQNVTIKSNGKVKLKTPLYFVVFGDSKGSDRLPDVLKIADKLEPQFCLTTADLVNKGGGDIGEQLYQDLDKDAGWFFRKYPTWPSLGNHEVGGPKSNTGQGNYDSGIENFGDFFGLQSHCHHNHEESA